MIFRVLLLLSEKYEKLKSPFALTAVCAYCAVVAALTFDKSNLIALLPMFANILSMGAMWTRRPNFIRIEQFAVTSPCWLIFNISTFSIAGTFTEAFNLVSIAVYYIRILIRKNKEKKAAKEALPDEKS